MKTKTQLNNRNVQLSLAIAVILMFIESIRFLIEKIISGKTKPIYDNFFGSLSCPISLWLSIIIILIIMIVIENKKIGYAN